MAAKLHAESTAPRASATRRRIGQTDTPARPTASPANRPSGVRHQHDSATLSGETPGDSEPHLTVNPSMQQIVGTAFTRIRRRAACADSHFAERRFRGN